MFKYSEKAKDAAVQFFKNLNSINIFVEDTTNLNYYRTIIGRLFPEICTIRKIFQRNGRDGVIDAANQKKFSGMKNAVFLIDGDLYLLCGEMVAIPDNVITLNVYCIENYFYCLEAAEKLANLCETDLSKEEIINVLSLKKWNISLEAKLKELFLWYAVSRKLSGQVKTVSVNIASFINGGKDLPDKVKLKTKITEIRTNLITEHGRTNVYKEYNLVKENMENQGFSIKNICGKRYLIPALAKRLEQKTSFRDKIGLPMRMAHEASLENFSFLRAEILKRVNLEGQR